MSKFFGYIILWHFIFFSIVYTGEKLHILSTDKYEVEKKNGKLCKKYHIDKKIVEWTDYIESGASRWNNITCIELVRDSSMKVILPIDIETRAGEDDTANVISIAPITRPEALAQTLRWYDYNFDSTANQAKIIFNLAKKNKFENNVDLIKNTSTHEFGHFIGMPHNIDSNSIMYMYGTFFITKPKFPIKSDIFLLQEMYSQMCSDVK
jgi:hypothetical protein